MFQFNISRIVVIIFVLLNTNTFAQDFSNYVYRYSQPGIYGTARMLGIGGCGVAMGADLSSASMNPGGLGMYNKSDAGGSILIGVATTNSTYNTNYSSTDTRDSKAWFSIPNLGMTFYNESKNPNSAFKGGTFAVTYSKSINYQNRLSYAGDEEVHSMTEYFAEQVNGVPFSDITSDNPVNGVVQDFPSMFYNTYLIDNVSGTNNYISNFTPLPSQNQGSVTTSKGQYRWDIAYGANILNRLYIGATLGIATLNYKLEKQHQEVVYPSVYLPGDNLVNFSFQDNLQNKSTTVNLKIGAIYKVTDQFRIAGTIMTPTSYMIHSTDVQNASSQVLLSSGGSIYSSLSTVPYNDRYKYVAPPKFEAGATYVFNKAGLITGGLEYLPYAWAHFKDPEDVTAFNNANKQIKNNYRNTINVKTGLELRNGTTYYRCGLAYSPDPYLKSFDNINRDQWNITAGWGIRTSSYYFDIAAVNTRFKSVYQPYYLSSGGTPTVNYKSSTLQFTLTAGILY